MNVKLLRKVKKHILEEPKRLYMRSYVRKRGEGIGLITSDTHRRRAFPRCGTAACIAGWSLILSGKEIDSTQGYRVEACELIGIPVDKSYRLFDPDGWPAKFREGAKDDGKTETAKVAAARIEHFIKTKGAE